MKNWEIKEGGDYTIICISCGLEQGTGIEHGRHFQENVPKKGNEMNWSRNNNHHHKLIIKILQIKESENADANDYYILRRRKK